MNDDKTTHRFDYDSAIFERVSCNLCGSEDGDIISRRDRYGLSVDTVLCRRCGLAFINPRMTARHYDRFYQVAYREQLERYKGRQMNLDDMFIRSTEFGLVLARKLAMFLGPGLTVEVGSSCGGVLHGFKLSRPCLDVVGVEPSAQEASYARRKGIRTFVSLFENFREDLGSIQNIIIVRSFNHLLNPRKFLQWSYDRLVPSGKLVVVVLDFVAMSQRRGVFRTQLDHPFMFTAGTLTSFVMSGGFDVDYCVTEGDYVYLVASQGNRTPFGKLQIDPHLYRLIKKSLVSWRLVWHRWKGRIKKAGL